MVKSLYSGVSGLKTHQSKMDVIGNNIANVNTAGFKTGVVTFKDVYYQTKITPSGGTATLGGVNPAQVGYGVRLNSTEANMAQSGFTYTDDKYSMALDGAGFFQVMDGSGNIYYTRAGKFGVDADGYLVNASGYHVLGVTGASDGVQPSSEQIRIIVPDTNAHASSATKMVNGTNVTISVSAPSDHTDMSVTFTEAKFPYATYANGILNIFFNSDEQYNSEEAFELAMQKALDAGGITLPDDVTLQFEFESIPDNPEAVIAANSISELKARVTKDSTTFYNEYKVLDETLGQIKSKYAYMSFQADKNYSPQTSVTIIYDDAVGAETKAVCAKADPTASPPTGDAWTITLSATSTADEINEKIKEQMSADPDIRSFNCSSFVMPKDGTTRKAVVTGDAGAEVQKSSGGAYTDPAGNTVKLLSTGNNWTAATATLVGGTEPGTSEINGGFDVTATVAGEYANNYKITFAYTAGYGKTNAVWNENELTITVCNDTTTADINDKIETAARGDEKKKVIISNVTGIPATAYEIDPATGLPTTTPVTKDFNNGPLWTPAQREAFFGGNPSIAPKDGADSFFTKTAKSLSTFALEDGRTGSPQTYDSLTDVVIQTDGTIIGIHPVHGYIALGRIDIALFDNPNGLAQVGGTNFAETVASGSPRLATAGSDGAGVVLSGALEMSNVDLSQEFTDMITTQRGFQANSRVITVSDTMLEELLSLKR